MSNKIVTAAVIGAMTFGSVLSLTSAAFAMNGAPVSESIGTIQTLHADDGSLMLNDGKIYLVPATINLAQFNDTQHVKVEWQQVGQTRVVTDISSAS